MKTQLYLTLFFTVFISMTYFLFDSFTEKKLTNLYSNNISTTEINSDDCKSCHSSLFEMKYIHAPMEESCENCHVSNNKQHPGDDKNFTLAEEGSQLCLICHDDIKSKKNIHYPVSDESCTICHSPHSSNNEKLLLESTESKLCFNCHDMSVDGNFISHKPFSEGKCSNCHDPHQSDYSYFLKKEPVKLCLSCHKQTIWKEFKTLDQAQKKLNIHSAIETDGCLICHKPHTSSINSLLTMKFPKGLYSPSNEENYELCFICHDSSLLDEDAKNKQTGFRNGETNLHYLHIRGEKGRSCISCHDIHSSKNLHLISEKVKFGNWEMPIQYLPNEKGGSCAPGCHAKTIYVR